MDASLTLTPAEQRHIQPEMELTALDLGDSLSDCVTSWSPENDARLELSTDIPTFIQSIGDHPGASSEDFAAVPWSISSPASLTPVHAYLHAAGGDQNFIQPAALLQSIIPPETFRCGLCRPQKNRRIDFSSQAALE